MKEEEIETKNPKSPSLVSMIMAFLGFIFWLGQMAGEARMEQAIDQYKNQVKELNESLEKERLNIKEVVVTEYVETIKYLDKIKVEYQTQVVEVPSKCSVAEGWVYLHDRAALGLPSDPALSSDPTDSGVKDKDALAVVTDNYVTCRKNAEQLTKLLSYLDQVDKAVNEVNDKIREVNKPK